MIHTVAPRESLFTIALQYQVPLIELIELNQLPHGIVAAGQQIILPAYLQQRNASRSLLSRATHTVKAGETLWSIATQYNIGINVLKQANNLPNNNLRVGQVLTIPSQATNATTTTFNNISPATSGFANHTVASGDSLWSIAKRYNTTVDEVKRINNLSSNSLSVGQILKVPSTQNTTTTPPASGGASQDQWYTVKAGDTLNLLAFIFDTTVANLRLWNNLTSDSLRTGQQLIVGKTAPTGNNNTVTPPPPPPNNNNNTITPPPPVANQTPIYYTVTAGDTLFAIAGRFKVQLTDLRRWNNLSSDNLEIGRRLIVGYQNTTSGNTGNNNTPPPPPPASGATPIYYTVAAGDTLFAIASRFTVQVADLRLWNNLSSDNLEIGRQLIVGYQNTSSGGNGGATTSPTPPPVNQALPFAYAINIAGTVGKGGKNDAADVRRIQDQLLKLGFLSPTNLNNERPFSDAQTVLEQHIPQTIEAIMAFQIAIVPGTNASNPDGLIRPNHPTLMYLNTATTPPTPQELNAILQARAEFELTEIEGSEILGNQLTAPVGATNNGNLPNDVRRVQQRLMDLGLLENADNEIPPDGATQAIPQTRLTRTIAAINRFQNQRTISRWQNRPDLFNNAVGFIAGVVGSNDQDLTFRLLRDFTEYYVAIPATGPTASGKEMIVFTNFVQSSFTVSLQGISYPGKVKPDVLPLQEYLQLGLTATQAKSLKFVSEHEGNFDGINSYDKAIFSYGFIQFAGSVGTLAPMLGLLKARFGTAFQRRFQKYGIDVEYAINTTQGIVQTANLVVVSNDGKLLRRTAAEQALRSNKLLTAIFVRAAFDPDVQRAQIDSAKRKYVVAALNILLNLNLEVVRTLASDRTTVTNILVGANATAYKRSAEYTTLRSQNRIQETNLVITGQPIIDIIRSEKGITALIDISVNQWINTASALFTAAIARVAADAKLDTLAKLRAINEVRVLEHVAQNGDTRIRDRVTRIINSPSLSAAK